MSGDHPSERPHFSLAEAADVCGVAKITMRRALDAQRFPNARRADGAKGAGTGEWRIPIEDLLAAGYTPHAAKRPPQPPREATSHDPDPLLTPTPPSVTEAYSGRIAALERELVEERHRREMAELAAAERARALADLRQALLQLSPGPPTKRRPWWRRS
jgi:hypothetical protein